MLSCAVPGQVEAGRSAQAFVSWGISPPSPGVRRTFHHPVGSGVPVEARPGFGSKDMLFFVYVCYTLAHTRTQWRVSPRGRLLSD